MRRLKIKKGAIVKVTNHFADTQGLSGKVLDISGEQAYVLLEDGMELWINKNRLKPLGGDDIEHQAT